MQAAAQDGAVPETRWARSGELSIAYQVFGEGPIDLLVAPGFVSHCELFWQSRDLAGAFRRLAEVARVIVFDKREQGLSDRVGRPPVVEEMVDDALAVLDAAGSERAAVFGISEGGALAQLLAASHPQRCTHLILWSSFARLPRAPDYPEGIDPAALDRWGEILRDQWGGPVSLGVFAPSRKGDAETERWWAQLLRQGTSPRGVYELMSLYKELDVRATHESIQAPTLVMHRRDDRGVPVALGRYIAERIRGARFVDFPGADHMFWTQDRDEVVGEIEEFLTGTRRATPADRVLATVMFTDIVDSTAQAAELGDARWRELLDRHDSRVADEVERRRGRVVKTTGDGVLATFDGPARAIEAASRLAGELPELGVRIRAGLHTGEFERRGEDVGGMAVHIGARIADRAEAGEVLVSSTVKDLVVGSGIEFADRGSAELKGVPGEWRLFAVAEPPA